MKLEDWLDTLNVDLIVHRYPNQDNRWSARFEHCEVMDNGGLLSAYGNGKTPEKAIEDYIARLRGERVVFHAMSPTMRREYVVPAQLAFST